MPDDTPHVTPAEVANLWTLDFEGAGLCEFVQHLRHVGRDDGELAGLVPWTLPIATQPAANDDERAVNLDRRHDYRPGADGIEIAEAQDQAESEVEGLIDLPEICTFPSPALRFARSQAWLAEARRERHDDPERCLFSAVLAVSFAGSLNADEHPEGEVANLQAAAWAEVANARRLLGDHVGAEHSFLSAALRVQEMPLLWKMSEDVVALLISQREFASAEDLLEDLEAAYGSVQDRHSAARARLRRGLAAMYRQDDHLALEHFLACLSLLDLRRDPALTLAAFHNTIACTTRLGHIETARAWLLRCGPLYEESGDRTDLIRRRWAEAQVEAGLGNLSRADSYLSGVRKDFEDLDLPYEASIVTLDLCEVWIRRGKFREVAAGVDEAVSTFQALKIRREALAGLLLLQEAARAEQATVAMVQAAGAALRAEGL